MACACKKSANQVKSVKQVVKKISSSKPVSKTASPKKTVVRHINYRRPI